MLLTIHIVGSFCVAYAIMYVAWCTLGILVVSIHYFYRNLLLVDWSDMRKVANEGVKNAYDNHIFQSFGLKESLFLLIYS
jgi:hypothetical protein